MQGGEFNRVALVGGFAHLVELSGEIVRVTVGFCFSAPVAAG